MKVLVFLVFDDDGGGYNAVEGNHDLMVAGRDRAELIREIRHVVEEYFGSDFSGKVIVRRFVDEVLQF